jgi:hypothetical protein
MRTEDLIRALALDAGRPVVPIRRLLAIASLGGAATSLSVFVLLLRPRPDIATALGSPGFCLKICVAACLAVTALLLLDVLARPTPRRRTMRALGIGPSLLMIGVLVEIMVLPSDALPPRWIGRNASHCVALIPLLSAGPAACLLLALRRAAPANPGLAGTVIGLAAGGVGAILYALTCPDDSPLFVATWYSTAIATVSGACFFAGRRWLTW